MEATAAVTAAEVPVAAAAATAAEAPAAATGAVPAAATAAEVPAEVVTAAVPAVATAAEVPAEARAEAEGSSLPGPGATSRLKDQDTNKTRVIKTIIEEVTPDGRVLSSMIESETKKHFY